VKFQPGKTSRRRLLISLRRSATWAESFLGSRWSLAAPKGNVGAAPWASSTSTRAGFAFHPANAPRRVAEEHDVAGHALDGEVFVQRANDNSIGSATTVNSAVSGMAPPLVMAASRLPRRGPQFAVHAVAMDVGARSGRAAPQFLREHFENGVVSFARQIA